MKDWLAAIEQEENIDILYAVETGSRAWGLATEESDFDIRFIYRYRNIKEYLSLRKSQAVLEFSKPYDGCGFDIYKAFGLLLKFNPSLYEWAFSPHVYLEKDAFSRRLKEIIETGYSPLSLCRHYRSLSRRNLKESGNHPYSFKKQKQLLQAVRAEIIRTAIINTGKVRSPFAFIENAWVYCPELGVSYENLTKAKRQHFLLSEAEVQETISLVTIYLSEKEGDLPHRHPDAGILDDWLWDILHYS